jgi:hypothetical protein
MAAISPDEACGGREVVDIGGGITIEVRGMERGSVGKGYSIADVKALTVAERSSIKPRIKPRLS